MAYLCVLVFFVFFAGAAMTVAEGLWSNSLTLISILLCGPLAIAAGYPVGLFLQEKMNKPIEETWYFVFGGVWLVFFASIMVFRIVADRVASRTRMKFVPPLELAAGPLVGLFAALMFASFFAFTLYTIPVNAGEWSFANATDWQKSTLRSGSSPFYTVLIAVAGQEVADSYKPH